MKKFFLFLFVLLVSTYQPINLSTYELNLTETKLATIPLDYQEVSNIVFSANGKQVAYKVRREGKEFVVVGNQAGKLYDKVVKELSILISPDGQRVAYQARREEKEYLVFALPTGEKEGKPYDDVSPTTFGPDGRMVVCEVMNKENDKEKWFVIVSDGDKEIFHSPHYDYSNIAPCFSPDSRLVFYVLEEEKGKGKQTIFVTDLHTSEAKKRKTYHQMAGAVTFSSDGKRYAYAAKREGKWFIVWVDLALNEEREGPPYDRISRNVLSSDGQRLAYGAGKEGKSFLMVSNWASPAEVKESGPYDSIERAVFSPDGSLVAYPAWKEGKWCVVVSPVGKPDGEKEGRRYDSVSSPVFSPDGSKIVYPAMKDGKWFLVISPADNPAVVKECPAYDMVVTPIFSPDGSRLVYRARRFGSSPQGEKAERFIVVGDAVTGEVIKEGPVCDEVWQPVISADGKYVCYGARIGRELWWKVQSTDLR